MSGELKAQADASTHETLLTLASLGLIAEHLHQPIFAKNMALEFVLVNSAYVDLLGRSRSALLGKTEREVLGEEHGAIAEDSDHEVFRHLHPVSREQDFLIAAGAGSQRRPTTKLPLTDTTGRVTHVICVVGQAGEHAASPQRIQEELERYAQERTRALRDVQDQLLRKERLMVLGQLAAGLAHQIRNPLGAISNGIALVKRQTSKLNNPIVDEALRIAGDEIWEANRIIGDLLEYARIRAAQRSHVELRHVVEGSLASEPIGPNLTVVNEVEDLSVYVDEAQLRVALCNLIRNAREAMPEGGTLTLSTLADGDAVELRVADTGPGVSKAHRHLVFEPLVTSKPLGIGLGLPTARALVGNQGGTLDCVENPPVGACFVIRLPRKPRETLDTPPPERLSHADR
ncbi:MAG: hypothetical protein RJA70_4193 [Pseudomonadota bacterium]|jgi:signal transduction histidine kinase